MKKFLPLVLIVCVAALSVFGCSPQEQEQATAPEKTVVAVTIVPQETFVKAVGGDLVEVVLLVPPGNSPANYEPTPQQMEQFSRASLYFSIGVPTEKANILPRAEESEGMKIVSLAEAAAEVYPDRELSPGRRDPHVWLSPKRVRVMAETIAAELAALDEANRDIYEYSARLFLEELDELDRFLSETFDGVPSKKFIVFHPAFGYLADDYGLEMYALEFEGKEATPQRMQEMIDLAREEGIKVIFYQKEIDSQQSAAFAEEIGGSTIQLAPLSPDYIENLKAMAETMAGALE